MCKLDVCRSISLSKLLFKNPKFPLNYRHLSCKYSLSHHDWNLDINHLAGKVRLKNSRNRSIRDGLASCDILSNDDICR